MYSQIKQEAIGRDENDKKFMQDGLDNIDNLRDQMQKEKKEREESEA